MGAADMATPPADLASKDRAIVRAAFRLAAAFREVDAAAEAYWSGPLTQTPDVTDAEVDSLAQRDRAATAELLAARRALLALCEGERA